MRRNGLLIRYVYFALTGLLSLSCGAGEDIDRENNRDTGKRGGGEIADSSSRFLALSDIHFDPFYDPALFDSLAANDPAEWKRIFESSAITGLGSYGADANYPLLRSSLQKMKSTIAKPDFIIIAGDFLTHDFQQKYESGAGITSSQDAAQNYAGLHDFIARTMTFLKLMVEETYPGVPVFSALGNNDAYCSDYMVQPNGDFLAMLADLWRPMLHVGDTAGFDGTFKAGGYYSVASPKDTNLRIIVANTIFMSNQYNLGRHGCTCSGVTPGVNTKPGTDQLAWLDRELAEVRREGKKAWIIQHIPPGADTYNSLKSLGSHNCIGNPELDMDTAFSRLYIECVRKYADVIAANFAGHYHRDDFRLIPDAAGKNMQSFMLYLPSIGPNNYNNPGFKVVDYNPADGMLRDYKVYYADLGGASGTGSAWSTEYGFGKTYEVKEISTASLADVYGELDTNRQMQIDYLRFYPVAYNPVPLSKFKAYWCIMGHVTAEGIKQCSCGG